MQTRSPTAEQQLAIAQFEARENCKISAYAGAGKTTTLVMMSQAKPELSGQYLAFNRKLADEAKLRFPQSRVPSETTHAFARRELGSPYQKKIVEKTDLTAIINLLRLEDIFLLGGIRVTTRQMASAVLATVRRFCQSDSDYISGKHLPELRLFSLIPSDEKRHFRRELLALSQEAWNHMADPGHSAPIGHDEYLKIWALSRPTILADYVLVDEAQDLNLVILEVLRHQQCQVVYVGDSYQQIYEWRGAIDAMQKVRTNRQAYLTESFRFGAPIAAVASQALTLVGETRPVRGNPNVRSVLHCDTPRAVLCRTNSEVMRQCIEALQAGRRTYIVGGQKDLLPRLEAVRDLKVGKPSFHHEFYGFKSWEDVVEFAQTSEETELQTFVKIVERHGEDALIRAVKQSQKHEVDADVVISTAHRAKGCEWDSVVLADDFRLPRIKTDQGEMFDPAEVRLVYVAMTRAKHELRIPEKIATILKQGPGKAVGNTKSLASVGPRSSALVVTHPQALTAKPTGAGPSRPAPSIQPRRGKKVQKPESLWSRFTRFLGFP